MAQARIHGGDDIVIVNHEDEFVYPPSNSNDVADDLHPNSNGYHKMSDVWLFPLIGQGTQTGTGTGKNTGAHRGAGILEKCQ